jgi:dipeptidase D
MMTNSLDNLEPKVLWTYFRELSKIPRGSKNETAAVAWLEEQGRELGLEVIRDTVGNVVIRKSATPGLEGRPGVILQAHVDMVCEKNEGIQHDFEKDAIKLRIDGDMLYATDTTLGADNGIGVSAGLALLASKDIPHGPLELLVTIDEETGLSGANAFAGGVLKGKYFVNLDSEAEGTLTIGCAGGMDTIATKTIVWTEPTPGQNGFRLRVSGLKGGHSGLDIHLGRGNAIRILGQLLYSLVPEFGCGVGSIQGGNKRNAIPRESSAILALDPSKRSAIKARLSEIESTLRSAYGCVEPELAISLDEAPLPTQVMAREDALATARVLFTMMHGVVEMSPDIPGLVQTSTNLGVMETKDGSVVFNMLHRSSVDCSKMSLVSRVQAHCELGGFVPKHVGGYPGWKPEPTSSLVQAVCDVHQTTFGKPIVVQALHAGLECGIIGERYPGMEMVSIGPSMWDVHTPREHISIPSVANFWTFLVAIVGKI